MNTALHIHNSNDLNHQTWLFLITIVLVSSIVMADQNLQLDLGLDSGAVTNILNRQDWREQQQQEDNWRQKQEPHQEKYTWGAMSIYEQNNELPPILSDENEPSNIIDDREAAPKFQMRF